MAIYAPGKRETRHSRGAETRHIHADLNLTPLVDIFTVLVIFLLQNFGQETDLLFIPKYVELPKASQVKELAPAHLVTITKDKIVLDKDEVADLKDVQASKDWTIPNLLTKLQEKIEIEKKAEKAKLSSQLKSAIPKTGGAKPEDSEEGKYRKITVQADKKMDFLTIKKVMYTVTEAGAGEINFAVSKRDKSLGEEVSPK